MAVTINGTTGIVTPDLGVDGTTLVVDAANDRVGIGLTNPGALLSIASLGESNIPRFAIESAVDDNDFTITQYEDGNGTYTMLGQNVKLNSGGNNTILDSGHRTAGILLDARNHGAITFLTGGTNAVGENLKIDDDGRILVGPGAIATPKCGYAGIDVPNNDWSIIMGGSDGNGNRANNANKDGRFAGAHYVNAEEPIGIIRCTSGATASELHMGGGTSLVNAATQLSFYTAANTTTTNGTERLRITSDGKVRAPDNGKFTAGAGDDLQIYHDGSNSFMLNSTGEFQISSGGSTLFIQAVTNENAVKVIPNAAVELYHDGIKKFETESAGVAIHEDTDKVIRFTGAIGEIGNVTGFQATNTAASALTSFGIRATDIRFATGSSERLRITSTGLLDVSGGIHVTENVTPSSGRGIEIFEASAGVGQIQSFNRTGGSFDELKLKGSEVRIHTGAANALTLDLQKTASTLYGTSDGIFNLDTTDGRGSFIRFKENGTTKAWVGCAEGIGTLGDQDDLGLRAVDKIILKPGGQSVYLGPYDAPGSYTATANNVPYSIKVAPYGWQHHSEIAEISMGSHNGTGQDDGQIILKTAINVHSDSTGLVERLRVSEVGMLYLNCPSLGGGTSGSAYTPVRIQGNDAATLGADVRIRGGSTGYCHSSVSLQSTSNNNTGGTRGLGTYMYDEVSDVEWYAGRPYSGNDYYMITRDYGVTYGSSSGQTAQHGKKVMALDSSRRMSTSGREYHFSDRTYENTHRTSRIVTSKGKQGTLTTCTIVINCHSYGTLAYDISVGGYSSAGYARKGTLYINGALYAGFNSLNTSTGSVSHTFQYLASQKVEVVFSKSAGFVHPVAHVDVSFGGDGYFDPGDVSITWS